MWLFIDLKLEKQLHSFATVSQEAPVLSFAIGMK